jgi:hypothetical protein
MSNSPLTNKHIEDPNYSIREIGGRPCKISKITIHHAASVKATGESVARHLKNVNNNGSANYCIGYQGDIVLCVPEEYRAWTSNSKNNDAVAVTIEVANIKGEPNWEVSDISYSRLIDLCVDICRRNGMDGLVWTGDSKGTLTTHDMFAATKCPGPYLKSKMPEIAAEVTKRVRELNNNPASSDIQKPTVPQPEPVIPPHTVTPNGGYLPAKYKEKGHENGKQFSVKAVSGLNMRKSAGKQYDIITTLPNKTKVTWYGYYNLDSNNTKWYLVVGGGKTGYCMSTFLK